MTDAGATVIVGLVGLLSGYVAAHLEFVRRTDELWLKALEFLAGQSQKRNLGIAAIELYWRKKRHRELSIPLLVGAAIYLLEESMQGSAAHEVHNLHRIMRLLLNDSVAQRVHLEDFNALQNSLLSVIENTKNRQKRKGLDIPDNQLVAWHKKTRDICDTLQ